MLPQRSTANVIADTKNQTVSKYQHEKEKSSYNPITTSNKNMGSKET